VFSRYVFQGISNSSVQEARKVM